MAQTLTARLIGLLALLLAGACGSSPPPAPPPKLPPPPPQPVIARGTDSVSAEVGPAGGELILQDTARLAIPAGALATKQTLTLRIAEASEALADAEDRRRIGPTLYLGPQMQFAKPVTLRLSYVMLPSGYTEDDVSLFVERVAESQRSLGLGGLQTQWEFHPAEVNPNELVSELDAVFGLRLQFIVQH